MKNSYKLEKYMDVWRIAPFQKTRGPKSITGLDVLDHGGSKTYPGGWVLMSERKVLRPQNFPFFKDL